MLLFGILFSFKLIVMHKRLTHSFPFTIDDIVVLQMGTTKPGRIKEGEKGWANGLKLVLKSLRDRGVQDGEIVAKEIADYRRKFLGDPSMILDI